MTAPAASLDTYLAGLKQTIETALDRVLRIIPAPPVIAEPVRYALLGPGKRLRPCLTLAVAEAIATPGASPANLRALALPAACAVEMVHSYSLVHDDLPAMDDDALRRGRPTTHVVYNDGLAILAGDALLTDAFAVLTTWPSPVAPDVAAPPADRVLRAVATLANAAGSVGMVGGQAIDLAAEGRFEGRAVILDGVALEDMHARKTGALIRAASVLGAIITGAPPRTEMAIDAYALHLGLAFQIVDDVLDVEGSNEALGKTAGKDAAAGKPTFPMLYGVAESKRRAADCVTRAKDALADAHIGGRLVEIADWSLTRRR